MSKKPTEHAIEKASERYGLKLTATALRRILHDIHQGRSIFCHKSSNNRSIHAVLHGDNILPVVYDKKRGNIVTVLPQDVLKKYGIFVFR